MNPQNSTKKYIHESRGVALITALLMLSLFTVLTLSMVIATTSDTLIDGYYRNSRASFYAADSGLNAARQYLMTQVTSAIPAGWVPTSGSPTLATSPTSMINSLINTSRGFGATQSTIGTGTQASAASWPEQFKVDSTNTNTWLIAPGSTAVGPSSCTPTPACSTPSSSLTGISALSYNYPYKITVIGQSRNNEANTVEEEGAIVLTVTLSSTSTGTTSFSAWGMFINQSTICDGSYLVPGTITGPVFTNGAWNFGTSGSYIFTDQVGSANANMGYQYSGSSGCIPYAGQMVSGSMNYSKTVSGQTINPNFQTGVNLNQPTIALPGNSFNQKEAVIDSLGNGLITSSTLQAKMNAILKDPSGTAYPASGTPSTGVYVPYFMNGSTPTFGSAPGVLPSSNGSSTSPVNNPYGTTAACGGGILISGDAQVTVTAGNTATKQVYTIKQGTTTTTITIDTGANTTTVNGNTPIAGVPQQCDPSTGAPIRGATMLYVDGNITGLQGGGEAVGSIQDSTALDIVANGAITVTGDLRYVHEPVTLTQSGSTPPDTLIPANDHGQTLGIYTASGNINLNNSQSSGNLQIDASMAMLNSNNATYGPYNSGSHINTLTIVGGRIQNALENINTSTRNVWFDRRYASGSFAPPWFPSTNVTTTTTYSSPIIKASPVRTSWL